MAKARKDVSRIEDKKGKVKYRARIRWKKPDGREGSKCVFGTSRRHANTLADKLIGKLEQEGVRAIEAERLTFAELADEYKEKKLVAAVYAGATRVAGMRSWRNRRVDLKPLLEFFSAFRVQAITYEDLVSYRKARFELKTVRGGERSVSMVNRELSLLRSMFNYARRCGYLSRSPFEMGESLISAADEVKRNRILTSEEEARLLAQCVGRRAHLRAIIIAAADTALRKGELLALRWSDVNLEDGIINIRMTTTKTRKPRMIGLTSRLRAELDVVRRRGREPKPNDFIFGGIKECKRAFASACRKAGIEGLRFHDLRHTGTTRIVSTGLPSPLAMEITGHTQFSTFKRYVNVDHNAARQAAALLDEFNQEKEKPAEELPELIH